MKKSWDVVIAGAGPAGLSAALVLGRACRTVLLCDTGTARNRASQEMHAYLSRDGIEPTRFLDISRREVLKYPGVRFTPVEVQSARRKGLGFAVTLAGRPPVFARKLLIATGVWDIVPPIPGIEPLFGRSVFQCSYCDGWEMRGRRIAVYGRRQRGLQMARAMTAWARDIVLCTDGRAGYSAAERQQLTRNGIRLIEKRLDRLEGARGRLRAVVFRDGDSLPRDALFFDTPSRGQSRLAESLGCQFGRNGGVLCGDTRRPAFPVCSWRETSSATCSSRSSPRPKEHGRHSASTVRSRARTSSVVRPVRVASNILASQPIENDSHQVSERPDRNN